VTTDHLTDDGLSAALDGASTDDERAHLAACGTCQAALGRLQHAAQAVAAPPPAPAADVRDAAIARAIDTAGGAPGRVVTMRRYRPGLLAAAAVLVLVLASVPFLIADRRQDDAQTTAAGAREKASGELRASDVFVGPGDDLGEVNDEAALRQVLTGRLTVSDSAFASGGSAGAAGGPDAGSSTDGAAPAEAIPAPESPIRQSGAPPVDCSAEARDGGGGRGALVYVARLRFKGTPAQVLVFEAPSDESLAYRALVMAEANCQLLVFQSF
jgi:hypothetical protein